MRQAGFTLIEMVIFIVVTSLLMTTILLGANQALRSTPSIHNQWVAVQVARRCAEWFLQQRRLMGYSALSCPSTPSASACSAPSGFSVSTSVSCTTWNSDTAYKTITVTVGGAANATLAVQVGDY
ncbi:MAG: type II secretion system protein [Gammaproteobacteria bacterium]|nr:MAG: type II secretion system protein [Gammaproteobacteria bacterium]